MKRNILFPFLVAAIAVQAQNTYTNERITNNSGDVIGTARYVGMGGALGALGADMSVISWNPAGIGLYRKNDIALTFGGTWGKSRIEEQNRGTGTFDQIGFVYNMKLDSEVVPYVNLSFNYQKKIDFNHNFYADNIFVNGLSQMDQLSELTSFSNYDLWLDGYQPNLANLAWDNSYLDASGLNNFRTPFSAPANNIYTHHSEGALHGFDFNLSTNINNRAFFGITLGVDNMRYRGYTWYGENYFTGGGVIPRYDLYNNYNITGTGVNVKLGAIVRPIESSSFRLGVVVETPTWYRLRSNTLYELRYFPDDYNSSQLYYNTGEYASYLPFTLRTPWKVRASMGSTIGTTFAWDVDYEYAAYSKTKMGYSESEYIVGTQDVAMNQHTRNNLRGTHTLRAGVEVNATKNLAFRLGYNLSTSAYNKYITYDQYGLANSGSIAARDFSTSTSYMRPGNTQILTLGMGYRVKRFYIDLAYKLRHQKADFYAFDTSFTNSLNGDPVFRASNPMLANATIAPVGVDLTRQAVVCTLGLKF